MLATRGSGKILAPKKSSTRSSPATTTTTTPVTNAQHKALIDQGVVDALAARDADRSQNGEDNHDSGTGIERYVDGLRNMIHESVMTFKQKTMQDVVEFATELMDKKICTFAECQTANKRKQDDNQHQENKRQNTGRAYAVGPGEKKPYGGSKHYALNATITMMVHVLLNATSATKLAIWPVTVGVLLLLAISETSLAINVGIKGTTRVIAQS
nr:hypothetical protein [Tanacetum cinerariifolium]